MIVSMIAVVLSVTALPRGTSTSVAIRAEGTDHLYEIDADRDLTFIGPLGTTSIEIRDRMVRVVSDPGPQQICVNQGWIQSPGQWLICLPNRVFVQINGELDPGSVDATVF